MGQTILYRLFKIGRIPQEAYPALKAEGILVSDEGIGGWYITKDFRAPGKYHKYRMKGFSGSLTLTKNRILAYAYGDRAINISFEDPKISALSVALLNDSQIEISFDASTFHDDWQGMIALRFNTAKAQEFYQALIKTGVQYAP